MKIKISLLFYPKSLNGAFTLRTAARLCFWSLTLLSLFLRPPLPPLVPTWEPTRSLTPLPHAYSCLLAFAQASASAGTFCPRVFAWVTPSSFHSGLNPRVTSSEEPYLTTHPLTLLGIFSSVHCDLGFSYLVICFLIG